MKKVWPAAQRNSADILKVLRRVLPASGLTLEIASGTGQHAAYICNALPELRWQPTDYDHGALPSIDAWRLENTHSNFLPALPLDVRSETWPIASADAVYCANMIHIAPWACCVGLFRGAAEVLVPGGLLVLYGPFFERDIETAASNTRFDASLKSREASWGIRHREEVEVVAEANDMRLEERIAMPANNLCLVFRR